MSIADAWDRADRKIFEEHMGEMAQVSAVAANHMKWLTYVLAGTAVVNIFILIFNKPAPTIVHVPYVVVQHSPAPSTGSLERDRSRDKTPGSQELSGDE